MIGDAKILIAARKRRLRHRLQRVGAVGAIGMRMKNAFDICVGNKLGQRARKCARNLIRPSRSSGGDDCMPSAL